MNLVEYASHDALGLANLIADGELSAKEMAGVAARAIAAVNPAVNAVVETYPDRIEELDETVLGRGPFRGVPFLIKDLIGHEASRKVEFGSRLCAGMIAPNDTYLGELLKKSGVNIIGRSAMPEYGLSATTESALHGNTCTPWRPGYSAGGSTGGGMAAVASGMVPIAHGSDIAGSIRIPASFCGGVGLKPSRGRITFGPVTDEGGWGLAQNFVQTRSVRDAAAMLDCLSVPQPGDPFVIPKPTELYSRLLVRRPPRLKIGWSTAALMGVAADSEVAAAVERVAGTLEAMGHDVTEATPPFDGLDAMRAMVDVWCFGLDLRLDFFAERTGRQLGPDTLEPITLVIYEHAKRMRPAQFIGALGRLNTHRRRLGAYLSQYDVWLTPTTPNVAEPFGKYHLGRPDVTAEQLAERIYSRLCQFTLAHNLMGTPAISLPLAQHSTGLPIGVQLGARPAEEHVVLQLASALEDALPWSGRIPVLHVGHESH